MNRIVSLFAVVLAVVCLGPVRAENQAGNAVELGTFDKGKDDWGYNGGWEFKGAQGKFEFVDSEGHTSPGSMRLGADFSGGGAYVAMTKKGDWPDPERLEFWVKSEGLKGLIVRMADENGQFFQFPIDLQETDDWQQVALRPKTDTFKGNWGGPKDGIWHGNVSQIWINVAKPNCRENQAGSALIDDVVIVPAAS